MSKKILAKNKRALSNYEILETHEAGIQLTGPEVKSVKSGNIKLAGAYASINPTEITAVLSGAHIAAYKPAAKAQENYNPTRQRKLLLNKKEAVSLIGKLKEKRLTLIPASIYSKSGIIKIELALARGKKKHEKREYLKKKDIEREIGRRLKS